MRVYLAGPIAHCTDEDANGWRNEARRLRPDIDWVDPMVRDFRGANMTKDVITAIVEGDKKDILSCDAVLRYAPHASEGSAQETIFAYEHGKRVVAFTRRTYRSAWLLYHAEVFDTLEQACAAL